MSTRSCRWSGTLSSGFACDDVLMECQREPDGTFILRFSEAEAMVLHEKIAHAEFADDLESTDLAEPVAQKVFSDVQQSLAPLIPGLGTDTYGSLVDGAFASIDPGPY